MSHDLYMHRSSGAPPITEEVDRVVSALHCFSNEGQATSPSYPLRMATGWSERAGIQFSPVMAPEDLAKAGPPFDSTVKKYG